MISTQQFSEMMIYKLKRLWYTHIWGPGDEFARIWSIWELGDEFARIWSIWGPGDEFAQIWSIWGPGDEFARICTNLGAWGRVCANMR